MSLKMAFNFNKVIDGRRMISQEFGWLLGLGFAKALDSLAEESPIAISRVITCIYPLCSLITVKYILTTD